MNKTLAVAKYLNELNVDRHGCDMDEMKMHKMMYFFPEGVINEHK